MKTCSKCGKVKKLELFYRNKQSKDGYRPDCKRCRSKVQKQWVHSNPELKKKRDWEYNLRKDYGITPKEYEKMFTEQEGSCAICEKHSDTISTKLHVDHNHITGEVRGLLCFTCNSALGKFKVDKDVSLLIKALNYLK